MSISTDRAPSWPSLDGVSTCTRAARPADSSLIRAMRRRSDRRATPGPHSRPSRRRNRVSLAVSALDWAVAASASFRDMLSPDRASASARAASGPEAAAAAMAASRSPSRAASGPGSSTLAKAATWAAWRWACNTAVRIPRRCSDWRLSVRSAAIACPLVAASRTSIAARRPRSEHAQQTDGRDMDAQALNHRNCSRDRV